MYGRADGEVIAVLQAWSGGSTHSYCGTGLSSGQHCWSLTLREERRLWVSENGAVRRILGPKRDEVAGDRRRLHNEELNDLYFSPDIIQVIKSGSVGWAGHVERTGRRLITTFRSTTHRIYDGGPIRL
jgi:hypothetical protein